MTILEALKTGKPLRRPIRKHKGETRSGYLDSDFIIGLLTNESRSTGFARVYGQAIINETDLFANDWEVKNEL